MKLSSKPNFCLISSYFFDVEYYPFPLIRNTLTEVNPFVFVSLSFALATLVLLPSVWIFFIRIILRSSLIIDMVNAAAYLCQTIGLETVHSARAAFITGTRVILVPFLMPFFKLGKPVSLDLVCVGGK